MKSDAYRFQFSLRHQKFPHNLERLVENKRVFSMALTTGRPCATVLLQVCFLNTVAAQIAKVLPIT
jgi:hypothetical protein